MPVRKQDSYAQRNIQILEDIENLGAYSLFSSGLFLARYQVGGIEMTAVTNMHYITLEETIEHYLQELKCRHHKPCRQVLRSETVGTDSRRLLGHEVLVAYVAFEFVAGDKFLETLWALH